MMIDSDKFIAYCEAEKEKTEARLRSFLRSDGVPKKGCSIGVMGCGDHIRGYKLSIDNMKRYIKEIEDGISDNG